MRNILLDQLPDFHRMTRDESNLYEAARMFLDSYEESSERLLRQILAPSCISEIEVLASSLLFVILLNQGRTVDLYRMGFPHNSEEDEFLSMCNKYKSTSHLSPIPHKSPLVENLVGIPVMSIMINNNPIELVFDTGSPYTILSSDTANYCNVQIKSDTTEIINVTGAIMKLNIGKISELIIGNCLFSNIPSLIIPETTVDYSDNFGFKLSGVIGWDVIKQLYWEIDYRNKNILMRKSKASDLEKNMCWDLTPMVKLILNNKVTCLGLDTGANRTKFNKQMSKFVKDIIPRMDSFSGIGQPIPQETAGYNGQKLDILLGNKLITISNAFIYLDKCVSPTMNFTLPGIIGSDIFADAKLILDYPNRYLAID